MKRKKLAIVGATGLVGETMIKVLEEKKIPYESLKLLASKGSAGKAISVNGEEIIIEELKSTSFDDVDYALFAVESHLSKEFAPIAVKSGAVVIDNSNAFRMDKDIPLIVPELNIEDAGDKPGIISNPNCSTIQSVVALKPILDKYGLKRVIYSTYQAVSGSGKDGLADLDKTISGEEGTFYPKQIAYNVLPHIDSFLEDGYTKEEVKMIDETRKILHQPKLKVTATTVRVPVRYGHSVSINIETEKPFELDDVFEVFRNAPGVVLVDDTKNKVYPTPLESEGDDHVFIGRIRRDYSVDNGINLWCVADNVRKGAASNAVQILEKLLKD
ncbi:MAG: aspartate-semialdehyde dehydrogenase [Clostridiaceae bacterium]